MRPVQATLFVVMASAAIACPQPVDPGFVWQVDLAGKEDGCAGGAAEGYARRYDYVLQFEGNAARVSVLEDGEVITFASGTVGGCDLDYRSVVWEEVRDGHPVRWRIEGHATWRTEGDFACGLEPGVDWEGTETILVVGSEHPDISAGCQVTLDVVGSYQGPL